MKNETFTNDPSVPLNFDLGRPSTERGRLTLHHSFRLHYSLIWVGSLRAACGLLEARKKKGLSQEQVANELATKAPVIGRYERDEAKPNIEAAARLASLLEVSLDYLVGNSDLEVDAKTLSRVVELQKLPNEVRDKLYYFIDMTIRDSKAKQVYAS